MRTLKKTSTGRQQPNEPLPELVYDAYNMLAARWAKTKEEWQEAGAPTPPVMISVVNRTETAARLKQSFLTVGRIAVTDLGDQERLLHIDSRVLKKAEADSDDTQTSKSTKAQAERLRQQVDTIGIEGAAGGHIQNVISVGMLSEGWDAKTVTHIMGLRAFTSALLCEQVVGRGLRRTSYEIDEETDFFQPEYVDVFGVPFTFLPFERQKSNGKIPPPITDIHVVEERAESLKITWPNVLRIEQVYRPQLKCNWRKIDPLVILAEEIPQLIDLAPPIDGIPMRDRIQQIGEDELRRLSAEKRAQKLLFDATIRVYEMMQPDDWRGMKHHLLAQLMPLLERFIYSKKIKIVPELWDKDEQTRRLVIMLRFEKIIRHIWRAIYQDNIEDKKTVLIFDKEHPFCSTSDMRLWRTRKRNKDVSKSPINRVVFDSQWEESPAYLFENHSDVVAWAKNDHLEFFIHYLFAGIESRYEPDFLIRLNNGVTLILEIKGQERERDKQKHIFARKWVDAVNADGRFGVWAFAVARNTSQTRDIIAMAMKKKPA